MRTTRFPCNHFTHVCLELAMNFTDITFADVRNTAFRPAHPNSYFLRLSYDSYTYWVTMTLVFIFICSESIVSCLQTLNRLIYYHHHRYNSENIDIIDFTDKDEYCSFCQQEFRASYGRRPHTQLDQPYDIYKYLMEKS